jgi:hypothetical protein
LAFLPVLQLDDDPQVVSTAALDAAALIGPAREDPLAGRRAIFNLATSTADPVRRGMLLSGLVALADEETFRMLRHAWRDLPAAQRDAMASTAAAIPVRAVAEFLLTWAEDALDLGDEVEAGRALGALAHMARVATGQAESPYSGRGVYELRRNFPAWAYPKNDVAKMGHSWTAHAFGRVIELRLRRIAEREKEEPKLAADVLNRWLLA